MNIVRLIAATIALFSWMQAQAETLQLSKDGKYVDIEVVTYQNLHYTKSCFKTKTPSCQAFDATKSKVELQHSKTPFIGHPASNYCKSKKGLSRILIGKENKQYDYCLFQDGSMVDSWDLYYKHFPK